MSFPMNGPNPTGPTSSDSSPGTMAGDSSSSCVSPSAKKLHGRAFYESIGSPTFVLAPMVDQSEFVSPPTLRSLPRQLDNRMVL